MTDERWDPKTTPWTIAAGDFPADGTPQQRAAFLVGYAILAPSSHNSQPWTFEVRDDGIAVHADTSRWLRVADQDQRELHISLGCAIENLLIAAGALGYSPTLRYFPDGEKGPAAWVDLSAWSGAGAAQEAPLFVSITRRSTNHAVYDDHPIDDEHMCRITACCDQPDYWVFATNEAPHEAELRRAVDDLITRADAIQLTDPEYKQELAHWIGMGVFGSSWIMAKMGQLAVSFLDISGSQTRKDSELLLSAPALVALGSAQTGRVAEMETGRIFERIALTAADVGLAVHPMSQILEVPEIRAELGTLLPEERATPQHTFRMGYAEPEEHTPRRPVDEVLLQS